MNGAERICATLQALGADTVFGLPGSQNVALFSALGASSLRTVVATSETAAAFMANGYARVTGRPGILCTIPGPGFTFALSGVAEAFLDSVPLVHLVGAPAKSPGRRFQLQAIDQAAMAAPITKAVLRAEDPAEVEGAVKKAYALSLAGEPGPVMVQIAPDALSAQSHSAGAEVPCVPPQPPPLDGVVGRLSNARRPLLYAGQGALLAGAPLAKLAEALRAPVVTTTSGRGVLSESHPWVMPSDLAPSAAVVALFSEADVVLAVGVKFSHNGARGFRLDLGADKLIHIDAARSNIGANFPASESVVGDAASILAALVSRLGTPASTWTPSDVAAWRSRLAATDSSHEPRLAALRPSGAQAFFDALNRALPARSVLALDSGQHQMLARRHFRVHGPGALLAPTNFQSMGYGIPAGIGAKLGRPEHCTVALVGDGGFALSGLELLTAVREGIDLAVIVFNDGHYGLIRDQQIEACGTAHGTGLRNPDFSRFASAVGARYLRLEGDLDEALGAAVTGRGVVIAEVLLRDSVRRRLSRLKGALGARARRLVQ